MIPLDRYFRGHARAQGCLLSVPEYQLGRIRGEAMAIIACRPAAHWLLNQTCIVVGYVEAFAYYEPGAFPWQYMVEKLNAMRRFVADSMAVRVPKLPKVKPERPPKPKPQPKPPQPKLHTHRMRRRHEGRTVTLAWYRRYGTIAK